MTDENKWPREIWMAERDEHDQGVVFAVLSEHATIARWEGDKDREREFHRYVDKDIYDSHAKYMSARLAAKDAEITRLRDALTLAIGLGCALGMTEMEVDAIKERAAMKGHTDD